MIKKWLKGRRLQRFQDELTTNPEAMQIAAYAIIDNGRDLPSGICEQIKRAFQGFFLTEGRWVK